jgi:hypothetical protein
MQARPLRTQATAGLSFHCSEGAAGLRKYCRLPNQQNFAKIDASGRKTTSQSDAASIEALARIR